MMPAWMLGIIIGLVLFGVKRLVDQGFSTSRFGRSIDGVGLSWGIDESIPDAYSLPDGWTEDGNGIWLDPECEWVIEGRAFLPFDASSGTPTVRAGAGVGKTLVSTLAYTSTSIPFGQNPAWRYVDKLYSEGFESSAIADALMMEIAPGCWDAGPSSWGEGVKAWRKDLLERVERRVGGK